METLKLNTLCPACDLELHIGSLWLTDDHQLLVATACSCGQKYNLVFPLTVLYQSCPLPAPPPKQIEDIQLDDALWLHLNGIGGTDERSEA